MSISAVALLTDFGLKDNFVGVLKGALLKINAKAQLLDISHDIASHNIEEAAFVLFASFKYFPKGTVFLAVVDPGVGSDRQAIAIKTNNYYFVGPDNGILSLAAHKDGIRKITKLENEKYFLKPVSSTFHARDIFAPVAGYISKGVDVRRFGKNIKTITSIKLTLPELSRGNIEARIIHTDKFGNLYTNITNSQFSYFLKNNPRFIARLNKKTISKVFSCYAAATPDAPFFINGSFEFIEIALRNYSAAKFFGIKEPNGKIIIQGRCKH